MVLLRTVHWKRTKNAIRHWHEKPSFSALLFSEWWTSLLYWESAPYVFLFVYYDYCCANDVRIFFVKSWTGHWEMRVTKRESVTDKVSDEGTEKTGKDDAFHLKRSIGLLPSISFIIGTVVGSGIFIAPKGVLMNSGSVGLSLLVWTLCGVLSTFGEEHLRCLYTTGQKFGIMCNDSERCLLCSTKTVFNWAKYCKRVILWIINLLYL